MEKLNIKINKHKHNDRIYKLNEQKQARKVKRYINNNFSNWTENIKKSQVIISGTDFDKMAKTVETVINKGKIEAVVKYYFIDTLGKRRIEKVFFKTPFWVEFFNYAGSYLFNIYLDKNSTLKQVRYFDKALDSLVEIALATKKVPNEKEIKEIEITTNDCNLGIIWKTPQKEHKGVSIMLSNSDYRFVVEPLIYKLREKFLLTKYFIVRFYSDKPEIVIEQLEKEKIITSYDKVFRT